MKENSYKFVDCHAHLELEPLVHDPASVIQRATKAGVTHIITVGIDLQDVKCALDIADAHSNVFACVGFHPHNASVVSDGALSRMKEYACHPKVVGYGEIGLDFFRNRSPHDVQRSVFADQLVSAKQLNKPVVIHLRNAYEEGLSTLERFAPFPARGVIHCFSGDIHDANRALDLGFSISIPGTVTYKKNDALRKIVRELPEDRILLETDCPFLAPEPLRGKDNEPAYLLHTARKVAEIREVTLDYLARVTTGNASRLFGLGIS